MQIQIDPNVPTQIPTGQLDDFKGFLDRVMDTIIGANGPTLIQAGDPALFRASPLSSSSGRA